ncbi:MAG TPA: class I SAM-dependent methyltransferase [Micavibrio sp.]|nr:class I SAM-dependent methyltransferase [Micavibrio sp.]
MSTGKLNQYGDSFVPTGSGHGVDISSQRQDELDLESLKAIQERAQKEIPTAAVDLGGGFGTHAVKMFQAGASVTMIDINDIAKEVFAKAAAQTPARADELTFLQKDFKDITPGDLPERIDILYSQRAIHYLRYEEARRVLSMMRRRMPKNGIAFISAAGYDTEYGLTTPGRERPIEERFGTIAPEMREKHGIHHGITLYKKEELVELLGSAGFSVTRIAASSFGNIKAIAPVTP